jgi:hypothetical protein
MRAGEAGGWATARAVLSACRSHRPRLMEHPQLECVWDRIRSRDDCPKDVVETPKRTAHARAGVWR